MLRLPRALRGGLRKPVVEGSTRYAAEGLRMAKGLHEVRGSCSRLAWHWHVHMHTCFARCA